MSVCPACNGIIGRDCWNPQECQQITDDMQRTTPARAEALDEGAAGEPPLYGAWNYLKDPEGLARVRSSLLDTQEWHNAAPINCNSLARLLDTIEALRNAHPSPTPAAQDDDRVRAEIKAWTDTQFPKSCRVGSAKWVDGLTRRVLAALKSTAAQEGGE